MSKTKVIAMYLPQYHSIPENDEFWGKGFTDWVSVKKSKPLYEGHRQPRIPFNNNYYDLSREEDVRWQVDLAKQYGIDGLGIYHYWFNNDKNILTKPAEILLENSDIDIDFFFAWDNANWKRSWSNVAGNDWAPAMEQNKKKKGMPIILIPYILGNEDDWKNHYNAVRPYFLDKRYIKKDNKPLFIIFNYDEQIAKMCSYWDTLAKSDGFDGMYFIFKYNDDNTIPAGNNIFKYEPLYSGWRKKAPIYKRIIGKLKRTIGIKQKARKFQYKNIWDSILDNAKLMPQQNVYHGAFVSYDDTPRRGNRGTIVEGSDPKLFKDYLSELVKISDTQGKDFVFLTAWNEWGEGAYLEPDSDEGFAYLEAISKVKEMD